MGCDDRAHGVGDQVGPLDARPVHHEARLVDEECQGKPTFDPVGASRPGEVETDGPVTGERRQHGREGVGGPAKTVDHQHRLALAIDLDGHALDEHCYLRAAALRHGN